ncbi:CotH kinase family protein [Brevibacillus centrosporus]|uniref:Uncharacterized protein n=1 Tax=Brevibacillus centrosporus TaxID=54910 RepID=A0A1I3YJC0_9BACL|nr:hypothetical protein [Brevibacillus centrosporus]SFK31439.1 hypothetical protein SAMN05518846_111149 [Brevibacillus centrosporus]
MEAIEETFLQQNFENARGDLYKPDGTGSDLKWISDDISDYSGMNLKTINFSITTPVSGTTLEDRPLLNALLSVDEYRTKYNEYLQEIATNYFTEEYMGTTTASSFSWPASVSFEVTSC